MRIKQDMQFAPVVITLESRKEVEVFQEILQCMLHGGIVPMEGLGMCGQLQAHLRGVRLSGQKSNET